MKFDNAFLTACGTVGLQYRSNGNLQNANGIIITIYKDKKGNLITTDGISKEQRDRLVDLYLLHANKYMVAA